MYAPSYVFASRGCISLYPLSIHPLGFLNCVSDYPVQYCGYSVFCWCMESSGGFLIVYVRAQFSPDGGGDLADIGIDFKVGKGTTWN